MNITHTNTKNETYTLVGKPKTELVLVHITSDLGLTYGVEDEVARSLLCDLLFSGVKGMNRKEFLDAINLAGGSLAVRAIEGRLTITIETVKTRLPKILTLAELMLTSPTFPSKEITRAKETLKNQLRVENEKARVIAHTHLIRNLYSQKDRVYQYTPEEELSVVKNISNKQLRQLYKIFLTSPWKITIGGDEIVAKQIQKAISKIHINSKGAVKNKSQYCITTKAKLITHQITSQQNIEISIGQQLPLTFGDHDYPAVLFALAVLGRWGGFSGRLMSTVREKEGLTYGIYARAEASERDSFGYWRIMTFFHPNDLERGIKSVLREIDKLYRTGITPVELIRFKNILRTNHILLFDSLPSLINLVHSYQIKNLTFEEYINIMEKMQKLTTKEINVAIKRYLDPNTLTYSLAGNIADASSQLKTLKATLKL